jgi:CheY-like chemotaxis protein
MTEETKQNHEHEEEKVVLVVEDEIPLQKAIQKKLEDDGFQVVTARKVKQAVNFLKDLERIDLIWLDHYLLGREDGLDFVARIKNEEENKNIPIVVVSNTASSEKVRSYLRLGVDKYYTKADYRLSSILEDIKKVLAGKEE